MNDRSKNDAEELSEIIEKPIVFMAKTKISIRHFEFKNLNPGEVHLDLGLSKKVGGEVLCNRHIFYLGGVLSPKTWRSYRNDLELEQVIEQLEAEALKRQTNK